ncbi:MAG: hypothetical protein QW059_02670 [Nitrososphaerota archaeon]
MRTPGRLLLAASLALLILAFITYQGVSMPLSSFSAIMSGATPIFELAVNVQLTGPDGITRPDHKATVIVGLYSAQTGPDGMAQLRLPPGKYSTLVKSSDPRLLPLTMELIVKGNATLNVQFKLARLYPDKIELDSESGSTRIRMELTAPEGERIFISYPQIIGLTPSGSPIKMSRGIEGFSNFFQRISPGTLVLDLLIEKEIAVVDVNSTFVPLEIIEWQVSA